MSGKAITSMVTGILAIILCWTGYLGMILGIVAIVMFGLTRKAKEKSGMAVTGLVTGIIGLLFSCCYALFYTIIIGAVAAA